LVEGIDVIRESGLVPVLGPCIRNLKSDGIHAASIEDRVEELDWAFRDPQISAVICAIGGMGSAGVLPHLDYDMIAKSRKPLLGRSDITALNTALLSKSGLISISGQTPSIRVDRSRVEMDEEIETFFSTLRMMMSDKVWGYKPFENNVYIPRTVSLGRARGHVIGGNCDTFCRLIGTPFMCNFEGAILFIEDVHKAGEVLAREFLHMKLAGILDVVAGVVIGEFQDSDKKVGGKVPSVEDVIQEYFSNGPPCVFGFSFSHGSVVSPIPIGADCEIDADARTVKFNFAMSA
jgi:muramoyltetrapeptide carboxypeptidase